MPKLGKPGETSVVLEDSITFGGENDSNSTIVLKTLEYMSYISKPYFQVTGGISRIHQKSIKRNSGYTLSKSQSNMEQIHRCR